jgi:hypothetical protein
MLSENRKDYEKCYPSADKNNKNVDHVQTGKRKCLGAGGNKEQDKCPDTDRIMGNDAHMLVAGDLLSQCIELYFLREETYFWYVDTK